MSEQKPFTSGSGSTGSLQIYIRLLTYVKPYTGYFALSLLGLAIFALTQPAFAKLLEYFVQALEGEEVTLLQNWAWLSNSGISSLWLIPALMIIIAIVRGIGSYLGNYYISKVANYVIHDLRTEMFDRMINLPNSYFDNNSSGHLIARITYNVSLVTSAATDAIRVAVREGLTVVFLLGFLFYTSWQMTLIFIAALPVIALVVSYASKRFRRISRNIQNSMGDLTHVTSETINGYREVRGFGGEEYEGDRFRSSSAANTRQNLKLAKAGSVHTPVLQFIVSIALALLLFMVLFVKGDSTTATLVGYVTAAALLPKPIRQLSEVNANIQKGIAAAESIFEMVDEIPEANNGQYTCDRVKGCVEFKQVGFTYAGADSPALNEISFTIEPGQTFALVGRSGSGKTTLANLVPRFYNHTEGDILIDGIPLNDFELRNLRSHIALVSQNITLFNDTVARNIAYGALGDTADEEDIRLAAEAAHATEFIKDMSDGIHTIVGEDGVLLSGGQRQRLAIARAVLKDAPILILDEATSALDTESERHIQAALDDIMKGRTTLVIAHRLSTIENADCILVMEHGRIIERGSHSELLAKGEHYAKLHKMQFQDEAPVTVEQVPA
ncbi:lipid A export permease/ATP-binding protein MsbA [Endozoicomonas elysicola]|uniref:Lipid transporter ATP-binding/permease n=1 Tax=Endozoicomonas elysicola TaxID=305900 RepID=A0A081K969_9GAMM|nr:lipid A export permease/ATP-binding protein MsbA [Endozoicomonas elysicola]KEI70695.1 lipid transporter ATP-binding/permease [Endozoicomonas elysicola]